MAVDTLAAALKPFRNWYLDLATNAMSATPATSRLPN